MRWLACLAISAAVGFAAAWFAPPHVDQVACETATHRACILTYTEGTLTGISWYDSHAERDAVLTASDG